MKISHDIFNFSVYFFNSSDKLRIDLFLTNLFGNKFSRTFISKLIKDGNLNINGKVVNNVNFKILHKDLISFKLTENINDFHLQTKSVAKFDVDLEVVYENENLLIINKPKGISIHPGAGNKDKTLVNILFSHYGDNLSNNRGFDKLGIVHRLDKDTTGLMLVAKNNNSHFLLGEMIKKKQIERKYLCFCYRKPFPTQGKITNYISRDKKNIEKMKIDETPNDKSKLAITNYRLIKTFQNGNFSLIECVLDTGRTHQIRLHMDSIKCSIVGDVVYNKNKIENLKKEIKESDFFGKLNKHMHSGQMLHSYLIKFEEPISKEKIEIVKYPSFYDDLFYLD